MTDRAWWQKPVRMMRYDWVYDISRVKEADLYALARLIKERFHCNVDSAQATPGIPPAADLEGGMGTVTFEAAGYRRYPGLEDWDWLRTWIPIAHEHDLRVVPYVNLHWFNYRFGQEHPDWLQRMADGLAYGDVHPLYGNGTTMCVNSPWRDWSFGLLRALAQTGADGAFLDGPVVFPGCCHCDWCRTAFWEGHGQDLPPAMDWGNPAWKAMIVFREESLARFMQDARSVFRDVNAQGIVFCNAGTFRPGAWRVARDIERLQGSQDISGAEAFFHPGRADIPLHFSALTGKYERSGELPGMVFMHHLYGPYHYLSLNEQEMGLTLAQALAVGAGVYFVAAHDAMENMPDETLAATAPLAVQARHEALWEGESGAEIALLASSATLHYYVSRLEGIYREGGSAIEEGLIADLAGREHVDWQARKQVSDQIVTLGHEGWFAALTRNHFQFDVLLDSKIKFETLKRYRVLILANCACLSDEQVQAILVFAERGGAVIATFESGAYDERGNPRTVWALGQLCGVQRLAGSFPASRMEEFTSLTADHASTAGGALAEELGMGRRLPRAQYAALIESKTPPAAVYYEPTGGLYRPLRRPSDRSSAIVQSSPRTVYLAEALGHAYATLKTPWHELLMRNVVRFALDGDPVLSTDAPKVVQIELWCQPGRLILHLVNNSGDMQRPISERLPVRDFTITARCPSQPRRAWSAVEDEPVPLAWQDGRLRVGIASLDLYDVIVVELQTVTEEGA